MFRIVLASCLLAVLAAAPADEKKTIPAWPNTFTMAMLIHDPLGTPAGAMREGVGKIWYDGEEGNMKSHFDGVTIYALKKYDGRGAVVQAYDKTGECTVKYGAASKYEDEIPLPPLENAQFVGETEVHGENIEQWQIDIESPLTIFVYFKRQEGVAIPVRFETYADTPPKGSDMILPTVVEVTEFSTSKPPASVFQFDASKCKEAPELRFLSGIYRF